MTSSSVDALAAIRIPFVRAFVLARVAAALGTQIVTVAVGWQLYERTGSAWSLGLVGLFELTPVLLFTVPAGNIADRYPRRTVAMLAQVVAGIAALGLMAVSWVQGPISVVYAMLLLVGAARAFAGPAVSTILPQLLKAEQFVNANAWSSSAFQFASVSGPALGGLIIAWTGSVTWAYLAAAIGQVIFIAGFAALPVVAPAPAPDTRRSFADMFAGFRFIRRTPVFLAAITLDMFAVLLGGAVALLPIFAKDILHVGADGLGLLRAAPGAGSLLMMLIITRLKPWRQPGRVLIFVVIGFGLATIGFGLSTSFILSVIFLFLTGLFDAVSVVIRITLEQVVTPDRLRGRVSAINYVFIGFSNEFGAFESGATAALFGPVISVVAGGIGTIAVVTGVAFAFPSLLRIGPLHTLKPADEEEISEEIAEEAEVRHGV